MSQIGANIKKLRNVKGLSQQAFSELFNLTRGNISSYEEGRAEPKIEAIIQIAKYFSIPLSDLLEKQLTVNDIIHFEGHPFEENQQGLAKNFAAIPYISREAFTDGLPIYSKVEELPCIHFPGLAPQQFIAVENNNHIAKPSEFPFAEGAILFFEKVRIEILHTLHKHFGFYLHENELFFGKYKIDGKKIYFILNDWKKITLKTEEIAHFWMLHAQYDRVH